MDVKDFENIRLERLMKRQKERLRQMDQLYDYALIKDWDLHFEFSHSETIMIGGVFAHLIRVEDRLVLVSIQFLKDRFSVEEMLEWLDRHSIYWQENPSDTDVIRGASEIIQGVKFQGHALVLYKPGSDNLTINTQDYCEVTEEYKRFNNVSDTTNSKEVSLGKQQKQVTVFFNGEPVEKIPTIEFDVMGDFVYVNGVLMCADRIGDYYGTLGVFNRELLVPLAFISDDNTTISIDLYERNGSKLCKIKCTYEIYLENWERCGLTGDLALVYDGTQDEQQELARAEGKKTRPLRKNKRDLPILTRKLLKLVFACVYGMPDEEEMRQRSYLAPLLNLEENEQLKDYLDLLETMSRYNYRYRFMQYRELFPITEPILGPFETNSDGTSLWLARILAIKELYGLTIDELEEVLRKI